MVYENFTLEQNENKNKYENSITNNNNNNNNLKSKKEENSFYSKSNKKQNHNQNQNQNLINQDISQEETFLNSNNEEKSEILNTNEGQIKYDNLNKIIEDSGYNLFTFKAMFFCLMFVILEGFYLTYFGNIASAFQNYYQISNSYLSFISSLCFLGKAFRVVV